jgi:hypothetical protein|eukprot:COSAG01_NODE_1550_length_9943_cov_233.259651_16_plen_71_part_00
MSPSRYEKDDCLGRVYLPIEYLMQFTTTQEIIHDITSETGTRHGRLRLQVCFSPNDEEAELSFAKSVRGY